MTYSKVKHFRKVLDKERSDGNLPKCSQVKIVEALTQHIDFESLSVEKFARALNRVRTQPPAPSPEQKADERKPPTLDRWNTIVSAFAEVIDDPYTRLTAYQDPPHYEYVGIGMRMHVAETGIYISEIYDGGTAIGSGLEIGDRILSIDGQSIRTTDEVSTKIRAAIDSVLSISVLHAGASNEKRYDLKPVKFTLPHLRTKVIETAHGKVQTIAIDSVYKNVYQDFLRVLIPEPVGVVLDLRHNKGGRLEESLLIASTFLKKGKIICRRNNYDEWSTETEGKLVKAPVSIVTDEETASAAEIICASLQENTRARIFGSETFGKGSMQSIFPFEGGYSILCTTGRWQTPKGKTLARGDGVKPDVRIAASDAEDLAKKMDRPLLAALESIASNEG